MIDITTRASLLLVTAMGVTMSVGCGRATDSTKGDLLSETMLSESDQEEIRRGKRAFLEHLDNVRAFIPEDADIASGEEEPVVEYVSRFADLCRTLPMESIRLYELKEKQFAKLSAAERDARLNLYIQRSGPLRASAKRLLDDAKEHANAGRDAEAQWRYNTVQRLIDANRHDGMVLFGGMVLDAIERDLPAAAE